MPDQTEARASHSQPEGLRAVFAVNRDRLAVHFYAIGNPDPPGTSAGAIRITIQDPAGPPRRIEAISEATELAVAIGHNLSELVGAATSLQPAPLNPAVLALIR